MTFFKELRRRSRTSFRDSKSSAESNGTVPTAKSSSTLNSSLGSSTPPISVKKHGSTSNLATIRCHSDSAVPPVPERPKTMLSSSNRNSVVNLPSAGTPATARPHASASPFTPKLTSISDSTVVYQKLLLVYGEIGDPGQQQLDGNITVHHDKDGSAFPCTGWPVCDSHFKALVYLSPGWNLVRFEFTSPSLSADAAYASSVMINYLPLNSAPPLQLAIILGKDSPATFDAVPEKAQAGENGLDAAIRKYRMAAHLWQAFTAENMYRNRLGRRCFRFEEEWQTGTLTRRDWEAGIMKNESRVHVIRSEKTVEEIRDLQLAQQYAPATRKGDLFPLVATAIEEHFQWRPGQKHYVAALLLDSHWDSDAATIRGHAALGGSVGDLQLGIFGSHALQSYPSCVEEVTPAFLDCTLTDTQHVANDSNESGCTWEAINIGIGAHLHEVGHLLGCPHQENGVMRRDYVLLHRTFVTQEAYSLRTQQPGLRVCRVDDECGWHRLDLLRFRYHPCFRLPADSVASYPEDNVQYYPIGNGKVIVTSSSGIAFIEIYSDGDEFCRAWIEYPNRNGSLPGKLTLCEADLRPRLPENRRKGKVKLHIFSGAGSGLYVEDFCDLSSKENIITLPPQRKAPPRKGEGMTMNALNRLSELPQSFETRHGFKGTKLGLSKSDHTRPEQVILDCANLQTKLLTSIKVYSRWALDGIEFCYEDGQTQLFGKRPGISGGAEFGFDTRRGETLSGFYVRAGHWIDGIQILTSLGRKSEFYGHVTGGEGYMLMPPPGYSIAGIAGTCGEWVDGFQLIITR